ncbi:hypothetical protein QAD02_004407 [Eretmocerus hayati]|uniref:Uncharacterized protein n=1 Tax=Eretmocerus hayati TaxID=131215 RepID=A0ACC2NPN0_9HYME|nr:hypothetical protein QAD02_004407 [Eretmocerus hayati]
MALTRVNRSLISDPCLKNLSLRSNYIEKFEDGIFSNLTNLEYLDLSDNKLSPTILFSFGSVPSLKTLILDWNLRSEEYFTLEKKVYFPELTRLSLKWVALDSVAENWSEYFPKIEELDVSRNPLTSVDDFFRSIPTTLKSLEMEKTNQYKLNIRSLKNVTSLNLDCNYFHSIKRSSCAEEGLCLENFDGLESLSLASCDIKLIEEHAFENMTKLVYLDITDNKITRISSGTFGYSPSLSYLNIRLNPFVDVSFITELKNLTTLKMDWMKDNRAIESLFSLSSIPTKIQILSLAYNELSVIPPRFLDKLQHLRELYLVYNHISSLSPGSWKKNLKTIDLSFNNVSKIEDLHLSEARSLKLLDLRRNGLVSNDPEVRQTLAENVDLKL